MPARYRSAGGDVMAKTYRPLSSRELLIEAGKLLHGEVEWMSKFAKTIGVSRQLMSAMLGEKPTRPVTAETERKVLFALKDEAVRLRKAAERLDLMAALIAVKK